MSLLKVTVIIEIQNKDPDHFMMWPTCFVKWLIFEFILK